MICLCQCPSLAVKDLHLELDPLYRGHLSGNSVSLSRSARPLGADIGTKPPKSLLLHLVSSYVPAAVGPSVTPD